MFLIGMIGFTSTASTPLMEANQKTSFEKPKTVFSIVKNVQTLEITVINFERSTLFYFTEHCKNFNFTEPANYAGLKDEGQTRTFREQPPIRCLNFAEPINYIGLESENQVQTFTKEPPIHEVRIFPNCSTLI